MYVFSTTTDININFHDNVNLKKIHIDIVIRNSLVIENHRGFFQMYLWWYCSSSLCFKRLQSIWWPKNMKPINTRIEILCQLELEIMAHLNIRVNEYPRSGKTGGIRGIYPVKRNCIFHSPKWNVILSIWIHYFHSVFHWLYPYSVDRGIWQCWFRHICCVYMWSRHFSVSEIHCNDVIQLDYF